MASENLLDLDCTVVDVPVEDLLFPLGHSSMRVLHGLSQVIQLHVEAQLFGQRKEPLKILDL